MRMWVRITFYPRSATEPELAIHQFGTGFDLHIGNTADDGFISINFEGLDDIRTFAKRVLAVHDETAEALRPNLVGVAGELVDADMIAETQSRR